MGYVHSSKESFSVGTAMTRQFTVSFVSPAQLTFLYSKHFKHVQAFSVPICLLPPDQHCSQNMVVPCLNYFFYILFSTAMHLRYMQFLKEQIVLYVIKQLVSTSY